MTETFNRITRDRIIAIAITNDFAAYFTAPVCKTQVFQTSFAGYHDDSPSSRLGSGHDQAIVKKI